MKQRVNELPSTPIIVNAANEILVSEFLKKKMPFLNIYKHIFSIMKDRNYKKYAIKNPLKISQINEISEWVKGILFNKIKKNV